MTGLEKRLHRGLQDTAARAVPPLLTLERYLFRLIGVGFVLLTLTLASGIVFSEQLFGKPVTFTTRTCSRSPAGSRSPRCSSAAGATAGAGARRCTGFSAGPLLLVLGYLGSKFVLGSAPRPMTGIRTHRVRTHRHRSIAEADPHQTIRRLDEFPLARCAGAARAAGDRRLLLDRRDGDDGGQPLPAEAPGAARRARRAAARWRCSPRPTGCSASSCSATTWSTRRRRRSPAVITKRLFGEGELALGARHRRDLVPDPRVLRDHAEGGRRGARRPHRAARQLSCWRRCCAR